MLYSGIFDLPWWAYAVIVLILTHLTIIAVTIFLHRHQTHHAIDLHPSVSHLFRLWLWLTTGMVTKEWVAVHRKHHAKVNYPAASGGAFKTRIPKTTSTADRIPLYGVECIAVSPRQSLCLPRCAQSIRPPTTLRPTAFA